MKEFLTPVDEVLARYPELETVFRWGRKEVQTLVKCQILEGEYSRRKGILVCEASIISLAEFINNR